MLAGVYDGTMSCGELLGYGDFGIGTFDRLDGEMIVLDGLVYQVKADGLVYTPSPTLLTPFVEGINIPGYHFHFLSDDRTAGGHVLEFTLEEGDCEVDVCNRYLLILPEGGEGLADLDLSRDRSKELEEVER